MTIAIAVECRNKVGECPVWHAAEQSLYWVDGQDRNLFALTPQTGQLRQWALPENPGSFAFRNDGGGLIMAFRRQLALLALHENGEVIATPVESPVIDTSTAIFNDGCCDAAGRFWVGQMEKQRKEPLGSLYRVDPDLSVHRMDSGLILSNGIDFSPDSQTIYYTDTIRGRIYAADYDLATGKIANKRVHIQYGSSKTVPDGCTIDVEGALWVAEPQGASIARYAPDGTLERRIDLPVLLPTSVAFGGHDLDQLYITTASLAQYDSGANGGALLVLDPGVKGLPEPCFGDAK